MNHNIGKFITLIIFLGSAHVWAGDPMVCEGASGETSWNLQCQAVAEKYLAGKKLPKGPKACSRYIPRSKSENNTRCLWYPMKATHIPGFIAEAFYSRNKADREVAFGYLENFCRKPEACRPYLEFLDTEIKAHILSWRKELPDLAILAERLRAEWSSAPQ